MPRKPPRIDLYPKNKSARLDPELFRNPTAEYRGTPFWSWNSRIDLAQLFRQIEHFKQMGFGGFCIHSRTGLQDEYLGPDYLAAVAACTEKAASDSMLSWLYDEDRWPSGFAGGLVTRDPQYRVRHLLWTKTPYPPDRDGPQPQGIADYTAPMRTENGRLLARYEIVLKNGRLAKYRRLKDRDKPRKGANLWHAYLESPFPSAWFNLQTNVDVFSGRAIERFIETTHEPLFKTVGQYFGGVCPAIFTDEPQFTKKSQFRTADETRDLFMPWTDDFAQTYRAAYGHDILDSLPELFWNLPDDEPSRARFCYHDHTAERFAAAFGDTIGKWCEQHGIALTGHLLGEATLHSQTRGIGEAMRPMRSFHLPGIDILCDRMELTTAKQAQSVVHQLGRPGMLSELYGVTNWDFDFVGHKAQGDWQAALGVTVRVPHLAWVSMAGESKRDYPAAIGYQSPWFREYPLIENHFSRINTVMTRGKPHVRVAVIHPLESYWLSFGPIEQNGRAIEQCETSFEELPKWLLFGLVDFDYVSEGMLNWRSGVGGRGSGGKRNVGAMRYDAVVVPGLRTIRGTTLRWLEKFAKAGGEVIFAGEIPSLVDVKKSHRPRRLAKRCQRVAWNRSRILESLEPFREIEIRHQDGSPSDSILHQVRIDGKQRHIFFCNTDRAQPRNNVQIHVHGPWNATLHDTFTGESRPMHTEIEGPDTIIPLSFSPHGHRLLTLTPGKKSSIPAIVKPNWTEIGRLRDPVPVTLSEPNVLLLDQPQWRLNDEPWQPTEEILRLENQARDLLKLPRRGGRIVQPWTDTDPAPIIAQLQLKFTIHSDASVESPSLALEDAATVQIQFDGSPVRSEITGWWVDEAIQIVKLPAISPGDHELVLTIPLTRKTNVEWCYLLGDFGVTVAGSHARLIAPVRTLAFGDWTRQGLPFYAGNVTYHFTLDADDKETVIEVPKFKSPLLSVDLNSKLAGKIAFAPFQLELGNLNGRQKLDITAYGNRINAFGALHNANEKLTWFGPEAWRSSGSAWSYEYQLRSMGILTAPILKTRI